MTIPSTLFSASTLLFQRLKDYSAEEQEMVTSSLFLTAESHAGTKRRSGEPFLIHPLQVAAVLTQAKLDGLTVAAGLLHDTLEDTALTPTRLRSEVGEEVSWLVESVTHNKMFSSKEFQEKLYTRSRQDYRVAALKLADRAVNLVDHPLQAFSAESQAAMIEESKEFYIATLADIAGVPHTLTQFFTECLNQSRRIQASRQ